MSARADVGDTRTDEGGRLGEEGCFVLVVERPRELAGQLEVLQLVLTNGNMCRTARERPSQCLLPVVP